MEKKSPVAPFLVTRPLHRKHNYFCGQPRDGLSKTISDTDLFLGLVVGGVSHAGGEDEVVQALVEAALYLVQVGGTI